MNRGNDFLLISVLYLLFSSWGVFGWASLFLGLVCLMNSACSLSLLLAQHFLQEWLCTCPLSNAYSANYVAI